jgi:hypothetical protein
MTDAALPREANTADAPRGAPPGHLTRNIPNPPIPHKEEKRRRGRTG